jgi:hypothetical protein
VAPTCAANIATPGAESIGPRLASLVSSFGRCLLVVGDVAPSAAAAEEARGKGDDAHNGVGHSTDDWAHDRDVHGWMERKL